MKEGASGYGWRALLAHVTSHCENEQKPEEERPSDPQNQHQAV